MPRAKRTSSKRRSVLARRPPLVFRATYAPWENFWYNPPGSRLGGVDAIVVSPETALSVSAVWACIGLLGEGLSSLPLPLYRRLDNGGKERATDHPLYWVIGWQPNNWQTTPEFEELAMNHVQLRGNFYAEILENALGVVQALIPLNPDRVQADLLPVGLMQYRYQPPNAPERTLSQTQVHHRRGRSFDGIQGVSTITYGARSLGISLAGGQYAADFFNGAGAPAFSIEHPLTLGVDGIKNLRESVDKYRRGAGYLVLEEGAKATTLGISPRDAQLLEERQFDIEEVARLFNVPLHLLKVSKAGAVSYASIEMFDLDFVMHTLRPWAVRFEKAIWRDLLSDREQGRYVPEYLLDALLRGDSSARTALYKSGVYTINEGRERENLNPRPDGDRYPAVAAERDRDPEPPGQRDPKGRPRAEARQGRAEGIVHEAAARVVRKEISAATKAAKRFADDAAGWQAWIQTFYGEHEAFVGAVLCLDPPDAKRYVDTQRTCLSQQGVKALETWEATLPPQLAALALGEPPSWPTPIASPAS